MAVDLGDLVEMLQAEVDSPGTNSFPDAVDDDWINQLRGGFWEIVLDGILKGYEEIDGLVTPVAPITVDMNREFQHLVVFYAGIKVVRNKLRNLNSRFKAKAGPVEFEVENAATVLKAVMDELTHKRNLILKRLSDVGTLDAIYLDMIYYRDQSLFYRESFWTNY